MRQDSELIRWADGTCRGQLSLEGPMDPEGGDGGWRSKQTWRDLQDGQSHLPQEFSKIRTNSAPSNALILWLAPLQIFRPSVGHLWIAFWSHNWDKEHSWILPLELGSKPNIIYSSFTQCNENARTIVPSYHHCEQEFGELVNVTKLWIDCIFISQLSRTIGFWPKDISWNFKKV